MISLTNKYFIFSCILIVSSSAIFGKTTNYYKLVRQVIEDNSVTNVSGGQFISFVNDICYESDYKGIGVGHGTLRENTEYRTGTYSVYIGSSYWGETTVFKFNTDKSVLNVSLENGTILVYKRTIPPEGVYTCSLIRQQKSNSSSSSGRGAYNSTPIYTTPINPSAQNSSSTTQESTISNSPQKKWKTITYQEDCHMCRGLKYCWTCGGTGHIYGMTGDKLDCPNCTNGECSHCNSTGTVTKTKQVFE